MASKISADVSTKIDITARKNDSFFLDITVTNSDDTVYNLSSSTISFNIFDSLGTNIKKFDNTSAGTNNANFTESYKPGTLTKVDSTGVITINVPTTTVDSSESSDVTYSNMNLLSGSYPYTLVITTSTETTTILHGKFKVID